MTTILRNLLSILRRFKMATLLNILGLSVAFAAFIIIMAQIDYDRSFDKFHPDYDKIFRVEITNASATQAIVNRPLSELLFASSPHILSGTITNAFGNNLFFSVDNNGTRHSYEEDMLMVSPSYTDVFTFDMVEGTADALKNPGNVLIPLSLSQKLFGDQSAIGQMLLGRGGSLTVGGVYHDFPKNSLVKNYMFFPLPENLNKNNWNNWNYHAYIRVDDAANVPFLFDNFKQNFDPTVLSNGGEGFSWEKAGMDIGFTALPDVHYVTDVLYDSAPKASKQTLIVLFAIAIIIVLIAGINFTNFSTALTPMRIKSINTQKVLGGDQKTIRTSLVLEAILISLVSYLIGLGIIALFNKTSLIALVDAEVSFSAQPVISIGTALLALFTGLLAGLYPAYYMTSFPPALVLKGSFGVSPKGRKMRNTLISVQFIASFALIIGAGFMYLQNYYMQHAPLGYDKDELIVTNINNKINESREAFSNQLKTFAGVEDVTYAEPLLSSSDQYMSWGRDYKGEQINYQCLPVDHSFLKVMNVDIVEGRDFRREDANTKAGAYIFNEKAREMYNLELGAMIDSAEIVGFMPDVKFASFRTEVVPMAFYLWGTQNWGSSPNYAYIKVKAGSDMRSAMTHVRATLTQFDAEYPFNVRFFDNVLQQLYEKENSLSSLITLFSIIAIFISIVGVFGLVVFDSEYRRKEIGVRKVLGSTTQQILILFNKTYIRILCLCFVLAAPLAYYMVVSWLENFAYKTPLYWWVFLGAFAIVAIVTIATVTFQNYWTANENPVNSIKTE
ncbi:ABC transporter permease [Parabacteroides sp. OttesenSCG-928-G07]|nr:ABC transporter permease [Parabacteroides sp. OttesenSCG-928-G21]MDL2278769.1 ABC transporter permease [Parabacteroides sp. OttesenSCG-928-G07]